MTGYSTAVTPGSSVSALEAIRAATAAKHRRLEALPSQERLLASDYELAEYRSLLERLYGFYEPLVRVLRSGALDAACTARIGARTALLAGDLRDLGLTAHELGELPRCADLPALDTADRVLGCAYVLEGATLGGRVIYKHLMRRFDERTGVRLRFFFGDGENTGERWRRFCAILNAEAGNLDELCAAACNAFDDMTAWLAGAVRAGSSR